MSLAQPTTTTNSSSNKQLESVPPSDGAERGVAPTVDRSKFAPVSKAALARLDVAKAKLLDLVKQFHACGAADVMYPGEHKIIPFLPPECHLVGHCWSELRKWVDRNFDGWAVSRAQVPDEAKRLMKNPRKCPMYFVRAVYTKTQSVASSAALLQNSPSPQSMMPFSDVTHFRSLLSPVIVPAGYVLPQFLKIILAESSVPRCTSLTFSPSTSRISRIFFRGLMITISDAEESTNNHVWIKAIQPDSPLVGKIAVGDWLVVVNGINVVGHNSKDIADLLRVGVTSSTRSMQVARLMAVYHPIVATTASATDHGAKFVSHEKTEPVLAASPVTTTKTTKQPAGKVTLTETMKTTQPTAKENANSTILPGATSTTAAECDSSPKKKQRLGDTTNAAPEPLAEPTADDM